MLYHNKIGLFGDGQYIIGEKFKGTVTHGKQFGETHLTDMSIFRGGVKPPLLKGIRSCHKSLKCKNTPKHWRPHPPRNPTPKFLLASSMLCSLIEPFRFLQVAGLL